MEDSPSVERALVKVKEEEESVHDLSQQCFTTVGMEINRPPAADGNMRQDIDCSGVVTKRSPDEPGSGSELTVPLFVTVKEEPNDENFSDGSINENNFLSSDEEEECVGETSRLLPVSIYSDINNPSCSHYEEKLESAENTLRNGNKQKLKNHPTLRGLSKGQSMMEKMDLNESDIGLFSTTEMLKMENDKEISAEESEREQMGEEGMSESRDIGKEQKRAQRGKESQSGERQGSCSSKTESKRSKSKKNCSCETCGKHFAYNSDLEQHSRIHTGEKPFKCSVCERSFAQSSTLIAHMRRHTGERPFKCPNCEKTFTQSSCVNTHMRLHTGDKRFQCSVCKKDFNHKAGMIAHMRIHTGEKPFKCSLCEKYFARSDTLRSHMLSHSGEKRFICNVCNREFSRSSGLTNHERTHTGEWPFACPECGKPFRQLNSLRRHTRSMHAAASK